jgi:plasmid stabilization system protein ParE
VRKRVRARLDIGEQARRVADDNPEAARRFVAAVERTFALLSEMPRVGTATSQLTISVRRSAQDRRKFHVAGAISQ